MTRRSGLRAGDRVRVRNKEEILATLDGNGRLDELPFMPEMFAFCGQSFTVSKRAHKTCDSPNGLDGRRMDEAVHLEDLRCSGEAHGGCQARCLLFWKEQWLEPDPAAEAAVEVESARALNGEGPARCTGGCREQDVWSGTRGPIVNARSGASTFVCQSTQLPLATRSIAWWDLRQYAEDYASGNVRLSQILATLGAFLCQKVATAGLGLGTPIRLIYDGFQRLRGGTPYPWREGRIPHGSRTPSEVLNLQRGELVRIKSYGEILSTLSEEGVNRGMSFDAEMVPYCGGTYRVLDRVSRIIDEKTGEIRHLKNDCIILDSVVCHACYSQFRKFCPRRIYPYWREIWLERIEASRPSHAPVAVSCTTVGGRPHQ
jgi:hypothetical protein